MFAETFSERFVFIYFHGIITQVCVNHAVDNFANDDDHDDDLDDDDDDDDDDA